MLLEQRSRDLPQSDLKAQVFDLAFRLVLTTRHRLRADDLDALGDDPDRPQKMVYDTIGLTTWPTCPAAANTGNRQRNRGVWRRAPTPTNSVGLTEINRGGSDNEHQPICRLKLPGVQGNKAKRPRRFFIRTAGRGAGFHLSPMWRRCSSPSGRNQRESRRPNDIN